MWERGQWLGENTVWSPCRRKSRKAWIGSSVKNKWRWVWLEDKNGEGTPWNEWCKKIDTPGSCFCVSCGKTLSYASNGKMEKQSPD